MGVRLPVGRVGKPADRHVDRAKVTSALHRLGDGDAGHDENLDVGGFVNS
jgi:hypothetical protein